MAVGDVPLTPIIDTVTGSVTEIGRIFLRTLTSAVGALAPIDAAYWTSRAAGVLSAEVNLGALASGYLKIASAIGTATPSTVPTIPQADVTGLPGTLAGLAPLASPAFTGTPTAPTAAGTTNTTQLATTAMVQAAIAPTAKLAGGNSFTGNQMINGLVGVNIAPASSVQLFVAANGGAGVSGIAVENTNPANSGTFIVFLNSTGAGAGNIVQNGAAGVIYGTVSDQRLKTDEGRAADLTALRGVMIHDFTWIADGVRDRGVFAQDVAPRFPRAVIAGTDDTTADGALAQPWMVDYSKFVADLIVGWQQHDATITELRAELAALKGSR